jgi:hypothetical protein
MARNGAGTYSLYTPGNPVVTGTTISSTAFNNTMNDVATALTQSLSADGQTPVTANIPMNSKKITGLAVGTTTGDAVAFGQDPTFGAVTATSVTASAALTAATLTLSGALTANGNVTLGDAAGDTLTVNPSAVSWPGNPTHSGNHTFSGNHSVTGTGSYTGVLTQNANPAGKVTANTFTPTLTNTLNIASSTARQCQYIRVGPIVMVCGYFTATTSGAGTSQVKLTIPVATASLPSTNVTGSISVDVAASNGGFIQGDGSGAILVQWSAAAGASFNVAFSFMYVVT